MILQLDDCRIILKNIVPDDGSRHCLTHGGGWHCHSIGAEIYLREGLIPCSIPSPCFLQARKQGSAEGLRNTNRRRLHATNYGTKNGQYTMSQDVLSWMFHDQLTASMKLSSTRSFTLPLAPTRSTTTRKQRGREE